MIERIWRGWTTPGNADRYERLLKDEIFPGIEAKGIPGYRGIELLRREGSEEAEFITIMSFESLDAVRAFAGEEHWRAQVPSRAREILERFDERARQYEQRHSART